MLYIPWGIEGYDILVLQPVLDGVLEWMDEAERLLKGISDAALAYDEAIQVCANSPDAMSSYCTAEGETLDTLYDRWLWGNRAARQFLAGREGER